MNRKHLDDAYDHWKGHLFRSLAPALRDLHVVPMLTDTEPERAWSDEDLLLYVRLLGVNRDRVLRQADRFQSGKHRQAYFAGLQQIDPAADIFFDPDIGIAVNGGATPAHIKPEELLAFLPAASDRVLLIYQHAARIKQFMQAKLDELSAYLECHGLQCIGCRASHVGMVFLSRSKSRLAEIRRRLSDLPTDGTASVTLHDAPPSFPRRSPSATQ